MCPALTHQSPALKGKFQVLEEAIGRSPGLTKLQDNGARGDHLVGSLGLGGRYQQQRPSTLITMSLTVSSCHRPCRRHRKGLSSTPSSSEEAGIAEDSVILVSTSRAHRKGNGFKLCYGQNSNEGLERL